MKMIVVTSIREDVNTVTQIMKQAGIAVFSVSDTVGHKTEEQDYVTDNWFFGKKGSDTAALFLFSFTEDELAGRAIELVKEFNRSTATKFPIRAFVLPVETSSNQ